MISVVIPVFNTSAYLQRVLDALAGQDLPPDEYEVICVDNGSRDGSLEIIRRNASVKVVEEPVRSAYAARNRGITEARGDILLFTDSDCFPVPGWLSAVKKGFEEDATAQVLLGPRIPSSRSRAVKLVSDYENRKAELVYASGDPSFYFGYTNNMAVRREAMERYGPFVVRGRGADTIFVRRLVDGSGTAAVAYCPEMAVQHAELESIRVYYAKIATYARSRKSYSHIETVRPLSQPERLRVFREVTAEKPLLDAVALFTLLAGGALAWWWGGLGVKNSDA
jgi:glycosyltransferase involved in cell wall biosynthesis